ncbi:ATP-dependent helicase HrpB [Streptomyces liangshanensis]|uniref:ATP-dependent helicase HrpB n=1 Tax=Streptomyces liangshanensis TaxID=2717324 RepID=A0A6G9H435_9ACTN|nr:ATP-dependent helicase HrpB [Streptomyces liangshanensis]QIQ05293.1 ATP-dependent helicase HrpB [Streptomyces liangshanensis]
MIRHDSLRALPVRTALPALERALYGRGGDGADLPAGADGGHGCAVLCAPPGTGKTTLVPLVLAGLVGDGDGPVRRVVVAEPRRIAARAAARRMAWLLGEKAGERVGFTVRGERVVGRDTVVEVVTTGVLLQRLQRDQELAGVDVVILDECHERHLDADTVAAFLLDVRAALRPELRLVAASATTDAAGWARLLGDAPVVEAQGVSYPVEVVWAPPARPVRPPHGMRVDPVLLTHVASVVRRALAEREGDVLCFLPGVGEIGRVAGQLGDVGAEVLQVHGRAPAAVQDAVLAGSAASGRRRVVLATAVAESSLTVPGVRVVVDAGLAREARTDHARGLGALATVRVSQAGARQRAGRAGREAPGTVYRCWTEAEDVRLARFPSPEIRVADLAAFALQAACWGDPDATGLALLDAPPAGALAAARSVLAAVGAVDAASGRATERGVRMSRIGLHPRLARALLDGASRVGTRRAAEVVALLSEEPPRAYGDDLAAAWRAARGNSDAYGARWRQEARRLASAAGRETAGREAGASDDSVAGLVAALAFPERVARARGEGAYLMVSGTGGELGGGSALGGAGWLAVAVADRPATAVAARVRLAAVIDEATARDAAGHLRAEGEEVGWEDGDVVARRVERLGAVELSVRPLKKPDGGLVRAALLDGLRREGLGLLRWTRDTEGLRERLGFLHRVVGGGWPDVSDAALLERADEWLEPELSRARRRSDLARLDAGQALRRLLPWSTGEASRLDELAPERIEVPSGSRVRVEYGGPQPVLAVKLQELFGLRETPEVAGVPVLVHLLSPAGRPAAVTADLASFWREGYRAVRAELRGRYPRHPWPEDPSTAVATRRLNNRR